MTKQIQVETLTKKQINVIFSILKDKEEYHYYVLTRSIKPVMDYFKENVYQPTLGIWIKKITRINKTFYLMLDWDREFLFIIRNDNGDFDRKVAILLERIKSAVKEYFNISEEKFMWFSASDLYIYTKGSNVSELERKVTPKSKKIEAGNLAFWVNVYQDKELGLLIEVNTRSILSLIEEHILKEYKSLNEILSA